MNRDMLPLYHASCITFYEISHKILDKIGGIVTDSLRIDIRVSGLICDLLQPLKKKC